MFNSNLSQQRRRKWQEKLAIYSGKYLIVLILVITAFSLNYFYSISMMFFTAFILAYLTKGSRCK